MTEKTPSISGEFWTTSTRDMDNSAVQSQASVSSISTSALEANGGVGSANSPLEFVNHGKSHLLKMVAFRIRIF